MPHSRRHLAAALLAAAAVVASGCSLFPDEQVETAPPLATPVQTQKPIFTVHTGIILDEVNLGATISPARTDSLYFKQGGRVKTVWVHAGDQVKAGQPLMKLDSGDLQFDLKSAQIAYAKARLSLDAVSGGTHTQYDLEARQLDVDAAKVNLDKLQAHLADSQLVAPYDGQVVAVNKKPGDIVQNFEIVAQVADPTKLTVTASVLDSELAKLSVGQPVKLDFTDLADGGGSGTVVQLPDSGAGTTGPAGGKYIEVKLDKLPAQAKQGMVGKVHVIRLEKKNVLLLANSAIRRFTGRTYVLAQTKQGRNEVDVVLGIQGETETEIVKGLHDGDQVVGQ